MEMQSINDNSKWTSLKEAERIVSAGYQDNNITNTLLGLLAKIEALNNLPVQPYSILYKKHRDEVESTMPKWAKGKWSAIDEAKRLENNYFDDNICKTLSGLLAEIRFLEHQLSDKPASLFARIDKFFHTFKLQVHGQ